MRCEDGRRWQGRGDKIFRNSVPLVTHPFKFPHLLLPSNICSVLADMIQVDAVLKDDSTEKIRRKHRYLLESNAHQCSAILVNFRVSDMP